MINSQYPHKLYLIKKTLPVSNGDGTFNEITQTEVYKCNCRHEYNDKGQRSYGNSGDYITLHDSIYLKNGEVFAIGTEFVVKDECNCEVYRGFVQRNMKHFYNNVLWA